MNILIFKQLFKSMHLITAIYISEFIVFVYIDIFVLNAEPFAP